MSEDREDDQPESAAEWIARQRRDDAERRRAEAFEKGIPEW